MVLETKHNIKVSDEIYELIEIYKYSREYSGMQVTRNQKRRPISPTTHLSDKSLVRQITFTRIHLSDLIVKKVHLSNNSLSDKT